MNVEAHMQTKQTASPPPLSEQIEGRVAAAAAGEQAVALELPADLSVAEANALRMLLANYITRAEAVALDASQVTRVSTAALQMLLAFCNARAAANRATRWHALSQPMSEAIGWLGLSTRLQIPH